MASRALCSGRRRTLPPWLVSWNPALLGSSLQTLLKGWLEDGHPPVLRGLCWVLSPGPLPQALGEEGEGEAGLGLRTGNNTPAYAGFSHHAVLLKYMALCNGLFQTVEAAGEKPS